MKHNVKDLIIRKPWLLPFIASKLKGLEDPSSIAKYLNCSKKLSKSGIYFLKKARVSDYELRELCIKRKGRFFLVQIGKTIIIAKVQNVKVKTYTVPIYLLEKVPEEPKLKHRVEIAKLILEKYDEEIGNC
jgi:hypothetical protein